MSFFTKWIPKVFNFGLQQVKHIVNVVAGPEKIRFITKILPGAIGKIGSALGSIIKPGGLGNLGKQTLSALGDIGKGGVRAISEGLHSKAKLFLNSSKLGKDWIMEHGPVGPVGALKQEFLGAVGGDQLDPKAQLKGDAMRIVQEIDKDTGITKMIDESQENAVDSIFELIKRKTN